VYYVKADRVLYAENKYKGHDTSIPSKIEAMKIKSQGDIMQMINDAIEGKLDQVENIWVEIL
jgi:hypothetical protein